jgi:hypothetical protein
MFREIATSHLQGRSVTEIHRPYGRDDTDRMSIDWASHGCLTIETVQKPFLREVPMTVLQQRRPKGSTPLSLSFDTFLVSLLEPYPCSTCIQNTIGISTDISIPPLFLPFFPPSIMSLLSAPYKNLSLIYFNFYQNIGIFPTCRMSHHKTITFRVTTVTTSHLAKSTR